MKLLEILSVFTILLSLYSCQDDVKRADALRLQNKFDEAALLYQKAANEGNAYAMWMLSRAYDNGDGVDFNEEKAFDLLKQAANKGCKEAECDLAFAYMFGLNGINPDSIKGKQMFENLLNICDNSYIQAKYAYLFLVGADGYYEKDKKAIKILEQIKDKENPYYLVFPQKAPLLQHRRMQGV